MTASQKIKQRRHEIRTGCGGMRTTGPHKIQLLLPISHPAIDGFGINNRQMKGWTYVILPSRNPIVLPNNSMGSTWLDQTSA